MEDIYNYTLEELTKFCQAADYPRFLAQQVFNWIYRRRLEDFILMTNVSKDARKFLEDNFFFPRLKSLKKEESSDGTVKFLFGLSDGAAIESVYIPERERFTLCLSTQVGCKYACKFCASGRDGFQRNLAASEIINQYLSVSKDLNSKVTNIVFMGIGEPLDNLPNLIKAIQIFLEPKGLGFGKNKICVSTSGIIPGIREFAAASLGVKLSVSLHAAEDGTRTKIMPVNKKYPLKELIAVVKEFSLGQKRSVMFEYALIKGFNDSLRDAAALGKLIKGFDAKVNLINCNSSFEGFEPSPDEAIVEFTQELKKRGIFYFLRKSRGGDINAACGQLKAKFEKPNQGFRST